jgi:hypothetical protein
MLILASCSYGSTLSQRGRRKAGETNSQEGRHQGGPPALQMAGALGSPRGEGSSGLRHPTPLACVTYSLTDQFCISDTRQTFHHAFSDA